jgi:hypothetical protein
MAERYSIRPGTPIAEVDPRTNALVPTRELFRLINYLNTVSADLAALLITQTIANGVTTFAPSSDAVYDALAAKADTTALAGYQPLDADLTTIAGLTATTDNFMQSKSSAWSSRTPAQVAADLAPSLVAAQSDQETATSTSLFVSPGRQQYHPSAAKCWAHVTVSAGTPSVSTSYNMTSVTDNGVGDITFTIATDFSSSSWGSSVTVEATTATAFRVTHQYTKAAGTISAGNATASGATPFSASDPVAWNFFGFGDQ